MSRSSNDGYLKNCCNCGEPIYMKKDYNEQWRPYESWAAGKCDEGEWVPHSCSGNRGAGQRVFTPVVNPSPLINHSSAHLSS
jgi:hypothetical protein